MELEQCSPGCYTFNYSIVDKIKKGLLNNLELWNLMVNKIIAGCYLNADEIVNEFFNINWSGEINQLGEKELIKSLLLELFCHNDKFYNLIEKVKSSEYHKLHYDIFNPFNDEENFNIVITEVKIF